MSQGFNPFAGLGTAKPSTSGTYVQEGEHDFEIKSHKLVVSKKPGKVGTQIFIGELKTLKSAVHAVGSDVSYAVNMASGDMALRDLKAYLMGVTGFAEGDVDDTIGAAAVHASNPFRGVKVHCSAKKTEKGFVRTSWTLIEQPTDLADRIVATVGA